MSPYNSEADEFYVTVNLNTQRGLLGDREPLLAFFDRIKAKFPDLRHLRTKDGGELILEGDKAGGTDRWVAIESSRLSTGLLNPESLEAAYRQHETVLELAPPALSIGPLDCEALDVMFGFDFIYSGNHDEIVAEVLSVGTAFGGLLGLRRAEILHYEPSITVALDESCRLQCRVSVVTRTNAYQVRTQEFGDDQISVYLTVRQHWDGRPATDFVESFRQQRQIGEELVERFLIPKVVRPLERAIASR
ncbi:MAG: hypothetical protein ABS79_02895 [Planctomycetes bacterium SCN 63-9]|nr:MAG: hypothetical protein ABS79_02895 [Planctomycetes bacterium SCN 63-9]